MNLFPNLTEDFALFVLSQEKFNHKQLVTLFKAILNLNIAGKKVKESKRQKNTLHKCKSK